MYAFAPAVTINDQIPLEQISNMQFVWPKQSDEQHVAKEPQEKLIL